MGECELQVVEGARAQVSEKSWPRISGFRVQEELGSGAASRVYLAEQDGTGRRVALKVVTCEEGVAAERLVREARILASLDHPGLVRVHAAGSEGSLCWMALEHVAGGTLEELLAAGPLPWSRARQLWIPILEALAEMHRRGIVHRDVKPANILLDETGRPRLADFGLARTAADPRLTSHGGTLGTPLYMAPEQIHAPSLAGPPADVFSAALVLYAMLTGKSPFAADTVPEVLQRVLHQPLPSLPPDIGCPYGLERLLVEASAKHPERRPADAGALLQRLEDLESGRRARRLLLQRAGMAAAVLVLAAGVVLLWPRETTAAPQPAPVLPPDAPLSTKPPAAEVWPGEKAALAEWLAVERKQTSLSEHDPALHAARARMLELALQELGTVQGADTVPGSLELLTAAWPAWLLASAPVQPLLSEARAREAAAAALRVTRAMAEREQLLLAALQAGAGRFWTRSDALRHVDGELAKSQLPPVPDAERAAWVAACDAAVSSLVRAGERRFADTLASGEALAAAGKFVASLQKLEELREAAHLPGAKEALERQIEAVRSEDQRRFERLESTRTELVRCLALRRRGDALSAARRDLEYALGSSALEPLDAGRVEHALSRGRLLLAAVDLEASLFRAARSAAPRALGRTMPLRLHGECCRGERKLAGVAGGTLEWEREADGFRSRVNMEALDATTLLALSGELTLEHAAAAVVLARLNCGDALGLADSSLAMAPGTGELLEAIEEVRRGNASSAAERDAWDVLARVRKAMVLGDAVAAGSELARVAAIRERVPAPAPSGWREIHAEESGWEKLLALTSRQQKFASREGWLLRRDVDAGVSHATPGPELHCGKAAVHQDGIHVPAGMRDGEGLTLQIPDGAFELSWTFVSEPAMCVGSVGERSLVVVFRESVEAARGEPLHGLERGLSGWRRVDRALAFDGPLGEWPSRWQASRSFPVDAATRWTLRRESRGELTLERGSARLDLGQQPATLPFALQAPELLVLRDVRLMIPDR